MTSLNFQSIRIRSGGLLAALLSDRNLSRRLLESCPALKKIPAEQLVANLYAIVKGTAEDSFEAADEPSAGPGDPGRPAGISKTPALDQFTHQPHRPGPQGARSTRSSAAIPRSARSSTS